MFASRPAAPGTLAGFAVVTDRFVGLLGSDSDAGVAVELYRLLEEPTTRLSDVLDVFASVGAMRAFALVEVRDPARRVLHVAVCGDVAVELPGVDTPSAAEPGAIWFDGEVRGVESLLLRVGVPDPRSSVALPIRRGVVAAAEVRFDEEHDAPSTLRAEDGVRLSTQSIELPRAAEADAVGTAAPDPAASGAGAPSPSWLLRLPDGGELEPRSRLVFGRRPWRTDPEETATGYVLAPSPRREISSVHLEVAPNGAELHARDLGSTNGTLVESPGRAPRLLRDGRSTMLAEGDVLDLGEGFRVHVGRGG
ncbi:MAG: FHA domain-containing protein [Actinomycetales bacterium]|nr:FHA domain-containing protein [Actinomycetales bacterium]